MTGFVANFPVIGTQPMANFFDPDTTQRQPLGFVVDAWDKFWGQGRFVYAKAVAALVLGNVVYLDNTNGAVVVPNTANQGWSLAIAVADMAINEYGWFQIAGRTIVNSTASVAANVAIGIAAAGQAGANAAGKQLVGAHVLAAATTTVVKTGNAVSGQKILKLQNGDTDGWFVGISLSGTGVAASTKVVSMSADGLTVVVNNAFTAQINGGSITGTYNDATIFYNVIQFQSLIAQGAIT